MSLRKALCVMLCIVLAACLCGCGNTGAGTRVKKQNTVEDVLQAGTKNSVETEDFGDVELLVPDEEDDSASQTGRGYSGAGEWAAGTGQSGYVEGGDDGGFSEAGSIEHIADKNSVFDLTQLTGNMLFAEVFNMLCAPGEYMGETIKMTGTMFIENDQSTGQTYYGCFMKDALGCCSQGFEFELASGKYPAQDTPITVTGTFDTYEENGSMYCILRNAKLEYN